MDKTTNITSLVILTQCLYKLNNNCINVIKSLKERTKTPLRELAIDRNEKKEPLRTNSSLIKVGVLPTTILPDLSISKSIKENLTLSPVPLILALTNYNAQSFIFNPESDKNYYMLSSFLNDQFAINDGSNDRGDYAVTVINVLF